MYSVRFLDEAIGDLKKLDKIIAARVLRKLHWLAINIETIEPQWLRGELSGLAKLREGNYRVIYQPIDAEQLIVVYSVGHRSDIYKR
jgi:mRNA interferase RelE/StbE